MTPHIYLVATKPAFRRRGYGRELTLSLIDVIINAKLR
ncbi:GNAT family N-acetyltransferase [Paenibacillus gyeongsangnamensis]